MRRGSQIIISLCILFAAGCGSGSGGGSGDLDASPIVIKTPPTPKEGTGTADACGTVTARGDCQEGIAVYCDLEREAIRKVDCKAQQRDCVEDAGRGAICKELEGAKPPNPDPANTCGDTNIDRNGFCKETTAHWCDTDTDPAKPQTVAWDCSTAGEGITCQVDKCKNADGTSTRPGAFCCDADGKVPAIVDTSPTPPDECTTLGFRGVCEGEEARWCADGKVQELDCMAAGKRCEEDTCATGAFCCGGASTECDQIGIFGVCNGNSVRYCVGGNIQEYTCTGTTTCQEETCFPGAECCPPPADGDECARIGYEGECVGNVLRYCNGGSILEPNCSDTGDVCLEDACIPGEAACCPPDAPVYDCAEIGFEGICDGNKLVYCNGDDVVEQPCDGGKTCKASGCFGGGIANCCTP